MAMRIGIARGRRVQANWRCLAKRLAEAAPDRLAGTVLLRELRERGYTGGYPILKDHLMLQRPLVVGAPVVRFETTLGFAGFRGCSAPNSWIT
jgi:hypothetical protein